MSNINTEEKIKNLSADYIYQQAVGSLLLLLMSAMEDAEKGVTALPYEIPADLQEIRNTVKSYLIRLEDLLDGEAEARIAALEDCMAQKKRLLSIYETIYSYVSQWNILSTSVSDQIALRKYQEENLSTQKIDWSLFFADCHTFLESTENLLEQKSYMSQLLKCLPLYMTRDNYFDTIRTSLEATFAGESKEMIEAALKTFEGFCCPKENPLYGKYFPELAEFIGQKQMQLPHALSDEALKDYHDELEETFDILAEIEEYFSCILHDLNSLIMLFYLTYTFGELTEGSASYADLYHTVCAFIGDELTLTEKAAYLDTLNEQLEAAVEPVIDKANEIGKEEYALLQKAGSFAKFSEDTKKVLMTEEFIRDCFFGDLNDELFHFDLSEELPSAAEEEKKALFTAFLAKTRNHFDTLPAQTRKLAMQNLAGALPPLHSVDDAMDMIIEAIDRCSSDAQKALIVDKIGMVFIDNDYQSLVDQQAEDEELLHGHSHHHHHDCGCGHDHEHHHHHDCGCGHDHEHHHHHDCGCGHDHEHHHHHDCGCGHDHEHHHHNCNCDHEHHHHNCNCDHEHHHHNCNCDHEHH